MGRAANLLSVTSQFCTVYRLGSVNGSTYTSGFGCSKRERSFPMQQAQATVELTNAIAVELTSHCLATSRNGPLKAIAIPEPERHLTRYTTLFGCFTERPSEDFVFFSLLIRGRRLLTSFYGQGEGGRGRERGVGDGVSMSADDACGASTRGAPAPRSSRGGGGTRR
jgi:hypothetical protein